MPKIRHKSTNKAQFSFGTLSKIEALMSQGHSMISAAKAMNTPFSSLQKRLKKNNSSEPRLGRLPVFAAVVEKVLSDRIKYLSSIFYGVTAIQIRKAAYQYAEELKISHNFDKSAKMAGRDWLDGFLKRNSISVRKPKATSINRITTFSKEEVQLFYRLLVDLMNKYKFAPNNIYNRDETGISTVQVPGKILSPKGMKRVGSITSWERRKNITLLCGMSAVGGFVPPMFIFLRKGMTLQLEKDIPAGTIYKCSDNGWINEHLFFEWLQHFAMYTKPSSQAPVLLILDNHASHTSLMMYDFCKQNNTHMLSLPPHTSHRMQPLDFTFFGPLKAIYK
ncbi:Pogo transposable element with KRAB domain [Eumeta japonica]|uniref:Pogo transposable element with KRAB domain n=1 Tax=Eumeta variegata TaxID=151549 RepID=A0A4C1TZM1_EUMVA|nr:Pogo transposable element with KRAB domain [Eumeta japonica]